MDKHRVAIIGAAGRMGRLLVAHVVAAEDMELSGALEVPGVPALGLDAGTVAGAGETGIEIQADPEAALEGADAIIDFTLPESTAAIAPRAAAKGCALIIGTTGMNAEQRRAIADLADAGARIVLAPNMSVGVNLLFHLCETVAPILGDSYDIEVVEMHHNRKKDAPSGTAVRLGEILAAARGWEYDRDVRHGRCGDVGARPQREIGMHALRGGDVVGDHTVVFATDGERVELTHKAGGRETFVKGALRAVRFLAGAKPGLYDMQDVLGLRA